MEWCDEHTVGVGLWGSESFVCGGGGAVVSRLLLNVSEWTHEVCWAGEGGRERERKREKEREGEMEGEETCGRVSREHIEWRVEHIRVTISSVDPWTVLGGRGL